MNSTTATTETDDSGINDESRRSGLEFDATTACLGEEL